MKDNMHETKTMEIKEKHYDCVFQTKLARKKDYRGAAFNCLLSLLLFSLAIPPPPCVYFLLLFYPFFFVGPFLFHPINVQINFFFSF